MVIPPFQSFSHLAIVVLSTFSFHVKGAFHQLPDPQPAPPGGLQMKIDYSLANAWSPTNGVRNTRPPIMMSSHLTFANGVDHPNVTDNQLWQIARDAYTEMGMVLAQPENNQITNTKKYMPGVLTILAFDHEIILASSQKGQHSFSYNSGETPVLAALRLCQATFVDSSGSIPDNHHRRQGQCGEPMAAHLYYKLYPDRPLNTRNARVGTVGLGTTGTLQHMPPCGNDPTEPDVWGCHTLMENLDVDVLNDALVPAAYTLVGDDKIAGGCTGKNQIGICSTM